MLSTTPTQNKSRSMGTKTEYHHPWASQVSLMLENRSKGAFIVFDEYSLDLINILAKKNNCNVFDLQQKSLVSSLINFIMSLESAHSTHDEDSIIKSMMQLRNRKQNRRSFFQVSYKQNSVIQVTPEIAQNYEKTKEEQNLKDYFDETLNDQRKYLSFKDNLKNNFFKLRSRPESPVVYACDPLDIIKSHSQVISPSGLLGLKSPLKSMDILKVNRTPNEEINDILQRSLEITKKRNSYILQGGTRSQRLQKQESLMKKERLDILMCIKNAENVENDQSSLASYRIKKRVLEKHVPLKINERPLYQLRPEEIQSELQVLSNRKKYQMNFVNCFKVKNKAKIDKQIYEKRIRKNFSRIEKFQDFILNEVQFGDEQKGKLQKYFIGIRRELKKAQQRHEAPEKQLKIKPQRLQVEKNILPPPNIELTESLLQKQVNEQ